MRKIAIIVVADTTQSDSMGRIVNALMAVKEFKDNQDDVQLIFTGAGAKWIVELAKPEHQLHEAFINIKQSIRGVCGFCASVYGVSDAAKAVRVPLLKEHGANMSYLNLVNEGYQIITF